MSEYKHSTNQVGVSVVGSLFSTTDYSLFKKMKGNRSVKSNSNLEAEIKEMGQLAPVMVNSRYEIIDGQHRVEVLKKLNKPVIFIISDVVAPRTVISVNSTQRNWKDEDYLNFHCERGNGAYIRFAQIYKQYRDYVALTVLIDMVCRDKQVFKNGEMVIKDEVSLLTKLAFLKEFSLKTEVPKLRQTLQIALLRFASIEGVDKDRLIDKFISLGMSRKMHLFRNREQAFEVLVVEIYNHKLKPSSPNYIPYYYSNTKTLIIGEKE